MSTRSLPERIKSVRDLRRMVLGGGLEEVGLEKVLEKGKFED